MPELDRRDFLKLVGVGAGAAAAAGCSDPVEKLIPYVVQPEEITPGIAVFYASTCAECPAGCGLHVKTREGRPVKLEGNPDHPVNRGRLCARGQAGIGRTYHPDRFAGPMKRGAAGAPRADRVGRRDRRDRGAASGSAPRQDLGPRRCGRARPSSRLIDGFVAAVGVGGRTVYEPFAPEALREASRAVFGVASVPIFDLSGRRPRARLRLRLPRDRTLADRARAPVRGARDVAKHAARGRPARVGDSPALAHDGRTPTTGSRAAGHRGHRRARARARCARERRRPARAPGAPRRRCSRASTPRRPRPAGRRRRRGPRRASAMRSPGAKHAVALPPGVASREPPRRRHRGGRPAPERRARRGRQRGSACRRPRTLTAAELPDDVLALDRGDEGGQRRRPAGPRLEPGVLAPAGLGLQRGARARSASSSRSLRSPTRPGARAHVVLPDHTPLETWGDAHPRPGVRSLDPADASPALRHARARRHAPRRRPGDRTGRRGRAARTGASGACSRPRGPTRTRPRPSRAVASSADCRARPSTLAPEVGDLEVVVPKLTGDGQLRAPRVPARLPLRRSRRAPALAPGDPGSRSPRWLGELGGDVSSATAEALGVEHGDVDLGSRPRAGRLEMSVYRARWHPGRRGRHAARAGPQRRLVRVSRRRTVQPGVARGVNVSDVLPAGVDERGGRAWLTEQATLAKTGAHRRLPLLQFSDNQRDRQLAETVSLVAPARGRARFGPRRSGGARRRRARTSSSSPTTPRTTRRRTASTAGA